MSSAGNELVTSLIYSSTATSGLVVPLNVTFSFGLLASLVSIDAFSFIHSVRYFGSMVPLTDDIVVEFAFSLKCVLSW